MRILARAQRIGAGRDRGIDDDLCGMRRTGIVERRSTFHPQRNCSAHDLDSQSEYVDFDTMYLLRLGELAMIEEDELWRY